MPNSVTKGWKFDDNLAQHGVAESPQGCFNTSIYIYTYNDHIMDKYNLIIILYSDIISYNRNIWLFPKVALNFPTCPYPRKRKFHRITSTSHPSETGYIMLHHVPFHRKNVLHSWLWYRLLPRVVHLDFSIKESRECLGRHAPWAARAHCSAQRPMWEPLGTPPCSASSFNAVPSRKLRL